MNINDAQIRVFCVVMSSSEEDVSKEEQILPPTGAKIDVLWPDDEKYYPGTSIVYTELRFAEETYDDGDRDIMACL